MQLKKLKLYSVLMGLFHSFLIASVTILMSKGISVLYTIIPTEIFCFLCLWVMMFVYIILAQLCKNK
jgi:hypothetical protein